jgi:hypothetical protein
VQSLFTVAMRLGTILPDDSRILFEEVRGQYRRSQKYLSTYPIDLQAASTDLAGASLESLAQEFDETMVDIDIDTDNHSENRKLRMNSMVESGQELPQSLEAKKLHALLQPFIPETPSIIKPPERLVDSSSGREASLGDPLEYLASKNF